MASENTTPQALVPKRNKGLNYLLITPRTSTLPYPQNVGALGGALWPVPMGMAYVSSSLKAVSRHVYNLNLDYDSREIHEAIEKAIEEHRIDAVLTGGLAGQFSKIKSVVDAVKRVNPEIMVIVGGRCITPIPEAAMKAFECADIGILGEGEITTQELAMALDRGGDLTQVNGLIFKTHDAFTITAPRENITDLDSLPFPDFTGLECDKLFTSIATASVVAARSCPFNCTFCYGVAGKYRMRSVDNIVSEIAFLIEKYGVRTIAIIDELFVSNKQRILEFCTKIKPYDVKWGCTIHASSCEPRVLAHMRESGCISLNLGVESGSNKVLKSMNKKATSEQIERGLEKIQEAGIGIIASMIFGDIVEDVDTVEESLRWWRKNRRYPIELSRMYAFPGSFVYKHSVEHGIIKNEVEHLRMDCREANFSKLTDRQYREMSLRLTSEEAFYSHVPEWFRLLTVDIENQKTLARYTCTCGYEGDVWSAGLLLSAIIRCPECQQAYRLTFYERYSFSRIREEVEGIEERFGNIAFWGLGREMQLLLRGIEVASMDGVFLIDADVKKQGLEFLGKTVLAPDFLQGGGIGAVVPSPLLLGGVHYTSTIEQTVAKMSRARIVPFGELLSIACPVLP